MLRVTKAARRVIWAFGQTYARLGRRTLLSVVQMYGGDHRTYALQTVQTDIRGTTEHTLLFEYPLDNTWTYEAAIEPLGKNHRTYTPWPNVRCFSGPINRALPPLYFSQFQNTPRLPECFQSVFKLCECLVSVCVRRL
jgi:hypothetical protein